MTPILAAPVLRDRLEGREADRSALAVLVPSDDVLCLTISLREMRALRLDHRAGFLISLVDGTSSVETLLDICGMPREEALATLSGLLALGVVAVR